MATLHERVVALERGAIQHDKQIRAIRDLVRECERLGVENRKLLAENRKDLRTLAKSVRRLQ
jgi:hypothetical protein